MHCSRRCPIFHYHLLCHRHHSRNSIRTRLHVTSHHSSSVEPYILSQFSARFSHRFLVHHKYVCAYFHRAILGMVANVTHMFRHWTPLISNSIVCYYFATRFSCLVNLSRSMSAESCWIFAQFKQRQHLTKLADQGINAGTSRTLTFDMKHWIYFIVLIPTKAKSNADAFRHVRIIDSHTRHYTVSHREYWIHYNDVTMSVMASPITSRMIVYSTVYSCADKRKHESSASLGFMRGIHRWQVNPPHKGPVTRKMFPIDDVIMIGWSVELLMRSRG